MTASYKHLSDLAQASGIDVVQNGKLLSLRDQKTGEEFYSAYQGSKVSGALKALNERLQGSPDVPVPGSRMPMSLWNTDYGDGATLQERNYDLEVPTERPVRDPVNGCRLIAMTADGGLLDAAVREIVSSAFASNDGDDRGWSFATTVDREGNVPVNPVVAKILTRLYDEVIGYNKLIPAMYRMLQYGDAFLSLGLEPTAGGKLRVARTKWLPTFEVFRVEKEILNDDGSVDTETYFEQRRYLSDEDVITIPYMSLVHWRFDYRGGLYGRALFAGDSSYNYWVSLKEAERDLRSATRTVGAAPIKHKFPANYSPEKRRKYRDEVEGKRRRDGIITDYFISEPGDIEGVFGLGSGLTNMIAAVTYWRKAIATHARIPAYLLNVETNGARDVAQQPALSFMRLINSIRQEFTEGIKHIVRLEFSLQGLDPDDPKHKFRIVWPTITIDAFADAQAGESDAHDDTESAPGDKALHLETEEEEADE